MHELARRRQRELGIRPSPSHASQPIKTLLASRLSPETWERSEKLAVEHAAFEAARQRALARESLEKARQELWEERGRRYRQASLDNFIADLPEQRKVLSAMRGYARDLRTNVEAGKGVILVGPAGTGKDHLVASLFDQAVDAGYVVRWTSGPKLFARLRGAIQEETADAAVIRPFIQADILALSDPAPITGSLTSYQMTRLYEIIDARYNALRPCWVTLNTSGPAEAMEKVGAPIIDRLRDGALSLICDWPSNRQSNR